MIESIKDVKGSLYGTSVKELQIQRLHHLIEWRPKEYQRLMKSKQLEPQTLKDAERAYNEIVSLLNRGFQLHEAEEVVLPRYILTPPEKEVTEAIENDEI